MIKEQRIAEMREKLDTVVAEILRDVSKVDAYRYYTDKIMEEVIEQYTSLNAKRELPEPAVKVRGNYNVGYFTGRLDMLRPNEEGIVARFVYEEW